MKKIEANQYKLFIYYKFTKYKSLSVRVFPCSIIWNSDEEP